MGLINTWINSIRGVEDSDWLMDLDFSTETSARAYLKRMALESVLNFVGRTMSTAKFTLKQNDQKIDSDWDYILNVRPNKSYTAGDFWHKFFYKLLNENEILVILTDDDQLLIADDFVKETYAIFDDRFKQVIVQGYEFKKTFNMSDVIYLQYNNEKLNKITDSLFKDYGELFGRIIEISMRNNQIRAGVSIDTTGTANNENDRQGRLQNYINRLLSSFKNSSVAIFPKVKGVDYEEYTNKVGVTNQSLDELTKMKKSLIDDVARAVGVPSALVHGEMADLESNMKAYRNLCIKPLIKKVQDEFNAKLQTKADYDKGQRVKVSGILVPDILEFATQIDKVVSSGAFIADEVRDATGYDPLPNGEGKELIRTKNYEKVKGGEEKNAE